METLPYGLHSQSFSERCFHLYLIFQWAITATFMSKLLSLLVFLSFSLVSANQYLNVVAKSDRWHSGKESTYQSRRCKKCEFNPWVEKIPGGGNGNPFQYSCLGNPMDRGAWQTAWQEPGSPWGHKVSDMTELKHTQGNSMGNYW